MENKIFEQEKQRLDYVNEYIDQTLFSETPNEANLRQSIIEERRRIWNDYSGDPTNVDLMQANQTLEMDTERYFRIFDIVDKEYVQFDEDLKLKLCPMIGVIGTAPAGEGIDTETPYDHGGNMDCNKIGVGTTLYLPVTTEGALLSMGDLHALMGDGEVLICGPEIAGEVTVRVTVLKDQLKVPTPFLIRDGKVMTVQSAKTLDEASVKAANAMMEFVTRATKLEPWKSGMLMSLLSDMAVCQIVDPLKTIRVEFPLEILEHYGVQLP